MTDLIIRLWAALFAPDLGALGADDYATREAASARLRHAGVAAWPALAAARSSPDAEVRRRAAEALGPLWDVGPEARARLPAAWVLLPGHSRPALDWEGFCRLAALCRRAGLLFDDDLLGENLPWAARVRVPDDAGDYAAAAEWFDDQLVRLARRRLAQRDPDR